MEGNSNQNGRKQQFLKLIEKWKEIVISKLLFPSTLLFLEKTKIKWNGMEGNSNAELKSSKNKWKNSMKNKGLSLIVYSLQVIKAV